MSDRESAIADALRNVWRRHRDSVIDDLGELIADLERWNSGARHNGLATDIRRRAHRILGSLTMVGRSERAVDLRVIESRADDDLGSYATEVVDRVHDLLVHLREDV